MKFCILCLKPILKNQLITIVSHGVKVKKDNGDYNVLGDFCDKERTVHSDCISLVAKSLLEKIYYVPSDTKVKEYSFSQSLKEMLTNAGEHASDQKIQDFIDKYDVSNDLSEAMHLWFELKT